MSQSNGWTCCACVVLAMLCVLCSGPAAAEMVFVPVVMEGDSAAGVTDGIFSGFHDPMINNAGKVAFLGQLERDGGVTSANDQGAWMGTAGALDLIAREDDPAPGQTGDVRLSGMYSRNISDNDHFAFRAKLEGNDVTSASDYSEWSGPVGGQSVAAREGSPAAGLPATTLYNDILYMPTVNASGQIAFSCGLYGAGVNTLNNWGIWAGAPGSLQLVARKGDQAAGQAANVKYAGMSAMPLINSSAQVAFKASLSGSIGSGSDTAVYVGQAGSLQVAAQEGCSAAGTDATFKSLDNPAVNNAGQVAFTASLNDTDGDTTNDYGIWAGQPGSDSLAARAGDAAPALAGVTFGWSFTEPVLTGSGEMVFRSNLEGNGVNADNDYALWFGTPGNYQMVVREDQPMPGLPGKIFDAGFDAVANAAGQVVFSASPKGESTDTFWAWEGGTLRLIVAEGHTVVEMAPGDERDVHAASMWMSYPSGGQDGRARILNDVGELALSLDFTDGTAGLFVVTVPEPATMGLLAIVALAVLLRRRA